MNSYSTHNPQSATVKLSCKGTSRSIPCLYEEMQGKCLLLEASEPIPASLAVTVEYNDALFLGEIVICAKINEVWKVEVKVEQILTGLQSLITLRSRLLGEDVVRAPQLVPMQAA